LETNRVQQKSSNEENSNTDASYENLFGCDERWYLTTDNDNQYDTKQCNLMKDDLMKDDTMHDDTMYNVANLESAKVFCTLVLVFQKYVDVKSDIISFTVMLNDQTLGNISVPLKKDTMYSKILGRNKSLRDIQKGDYCTMGKWRNHVFL